MLFATISSIYALESASETASELRGGAMSAIDHYLSKPWLAHYPKGVPPTVEVPLKSLPQAFDEATERAGSRTAVVFYGRRISYAELRDATDRLACALARL